MGSEGIGEGGDGQLQCCSLTPDGAGHLFSQLLSTWTGVNLGKPELHSWPQSA